MAVDFSILQRTPTIGSRIMAGQQMAREQALQNRLLARQDLQFQQQQEDRARQLQQTQQQEAIFKQAADMIRQAGLDPDDPQVLQQFTAAAVQSRQPQLISLAGAMSERAAKRKQQQAEADALQAALTGRPMGARAAAPAAAVPAAPAAMTQPPAAPAITATTFDEGAARPEMPRPSIAARTAAVEPPMPMGPARELPPPNALVGPAPAAEPAANRLTAPADPNAERIAELEAKRDRLEMLGTTKGATLAAQTQRQIDKLKPKEYAPTELERLNAALANLPPGSPQRKVYEARIAKLTAPSKGVDVKVEYESANTAAQKEFMGAVVKENEKLSNAPDAIDNVRKAKQLIPGASTFMGKGGEALLSAASFLNNRLGFELKVKGISDATELRTRMFEGILENLKKLDSNPTQQQQEALKAALGSLDTDPNALPRILDRIEDTLRARVDRYNKKVRDAEKRGVKFPFNPVIDLPPPVERGRVGGEAPKQVRRTGTFNGRRVVEYTDGSVEYAAD